MEILIIILGLIIYFIPTMIASSRNHKNSTAIFACNLLLGWIGIGWIGAFIWSLTSQK